MENSGRRSEVIDGFRAISIFSVLLFHYLVRWSPPLNSDDFYGYHYRYSEFFRIGQFGVHIFFVISGLVIAMTIVKSQSVVDFAVRRFARLYPAYFVAATLLAVIISISGGVLHVSLRDYLATLTMAAPQLGAHYVDGAYWSLFVEVKFYILVAALFVVLKNNFWVGLIAVSLIGAVIRPYYPHMAELLLMVHFLPLFLIGISGWYYIYNSQIGVAAALLATGLLCYALNAASLVQEMRAPSLDFVAHTMILGGAAVMMFMLRFRSYTRFGPLAYIGRASYSWYLIHQSLGVIVISFLCGRLGFPDFVGFGTALVLSLAVACAMFEWVELPAQRMILRSWHHGRAHLLGRVGKQDSQRG